MRTNHLSSLGLRAATMIILFVLCYEAQEGRTFGASSQPRREAEPGPRARAIPSWNRMQPSAEILSAQFQATVYEVQGAAERLGSLDAKGLTRQATTPETLLSALVQTGKVRLLYRIEQPVNVFSTSIIVGSSEPVITETHTATTGEAINSINYQNVGFIVRLSAQGPPKDRDPTAPIVATAIRLSVLSPGEKEIAPGQEDSAIRAMSLDHSAALELNRPQVVLAISSNAFSSFRGSADGNRRAETPTTPIAYVIRYQFGPPAQGSGNGTAASPVGSAALESKPAGLPMAAPETTRSTNTLTAQLQATVYEVEAATNRLPTLDIKALERAPTPELMLNALNEAGKPRVLYRIDQPVNVFSDQVMIETNKPIVTATKAGQDGKAINSYTSHRMGVIVRLSAKAPPKDARREGPDVTVSFNLSAEAPGYTELGLGQTCAGFSMISQEHNEPLELGRPRVMLAMGTSSVAEQAKPFVYVVRYLFGPASTK